MTEQLRQVTKPLSERVAGAIDQYPIGQIDEVLQVCRSGVATGCYRLVTPTRSLALHIFPNHTLKRVETVLSLHACLARAGAPCVHPIATKQGGYASLASDSVAALFEWVEGPMLAESHEPTSNCIGRVTAQLHAASHQLTGPPTAIPTIPEFLSKIRVGMASDNRAFGEGLCEWIERALCGISTIGEGQCGLIHNDIHHRNIVVPIHGVPCLIDFGNCEHNLLTKDIGVALFYALQVSETPSQSAITGVLDSYCRTRPLCQADVDAAITFLRLKALEFAAWHLLRLMRGKEHKHTVVVAQKLALRIEELLKTFEYVVDPPFREATP